MALGTTISEHFPIYTVFSTKTGTYIWFQAYLMIYQYQSRYTLVWLLEILSEGT